MCWSWSRLVWYHNIIHLVLQCSRSLCGRTHTSTAFGLCVAIDLRSQTNRQPIALAITFTQPPALARLPARFQYPIKTYRICDQLRQGLSTHAASSSIFIKPIAIAITCSRVPALARDTAGFLDDRKTDRICDHFNRSPISRTYFRKSTLTICDND